MTDAETSATPAPIAAAIAEYVATLRPEDVPEQVLHETSRAFVNWLGCALGGSQTPGVVKALRALRPFSGPPQATVFGHREKVDILLASLLNCTSVGVLAFDDCHSEMILHPTGPIYAATFAYAQHARVTGADFAMAVLLGMEVQCRLGRALVVAPAQGPLGWYLTGIVGGVGAAAAVGRLQGLSQPQLVSAMSIAAAAASGFRALHGSDATAFVPAQAARAGLQAALLAAEGFTGSATFLEPPNGMLSLFAATANADCLTQRLEAPFEIQRNEYKPYPCGIVIHALINACLQLRREPAFASDRIAEVQAWVPRDTISLAGHRRHPADEQKAKVSLHHWAAAALLDGVAGIAQGTRARIDDPNIRDLRDHITAHADTSLAANGARIEVRLRDGQILRHAVSATPHITDADLDQKFLSQASDVLGADAAHRLLAAAWNARRVADVGASLDQAVSAD